METLLSIQRKTFLARMKLINCFGSLRTHHSQGESQVFRHTRTHTVLYKWLERPRDKGRDKNARNQCTSRLTVLLDVHPRPVRHESVVWREDVHGDKDAGQEERGPVEQAARQEQQAAVIQIEAEAAGLQHVACSHQQGFPKTEREKKIR